MCQTWIREYAEKHAVFVFFFAWSYILYDAGAGVLLPLKHLKFRHILTMRH